jgi:hypothetical protein
MYCIACHLHSRWFLAQLISLTLKMEAICFSEMLVDTQWTTQRYIPEDSTLSALFFPVPESGY